MAERIDWLDEEIREAIHQRNAARVGELGARRVALTAPPAFARIKRSLGATRFAKTDGATANE